MIRLMIRTVLSLTVVALGGTSILFAGQTGRQFSLSGSVVNAVTAAPCRMHPSLSLTAAQLRPMPRGHFNSRA